MRYFSPFHAFVTLFTSLFLFSPEGFTQNTEILQKRIEEIEQRQNEIESRQREIYTQSQDGAGKVNSFFGNQIRLGGFFETALISLSGPDMESQMRAHTNTLGLNIASEFGNKMSFVSQILTGLAFPLTNPNNNPGLTPSHREYGSVFFGSLVAQGYVDYAFNPMLRLQTGLGYVPFGRAFQQREPVLFLRRGGPQMLNTAASSGTVGLISPLWMGVHLYGSSTAGEGLWGYNLYTTSPTSNTKSLGGGARAWYRSERGLTFGVSAQSGQNIADTYYAYGADLQVVYQRLSFMTEYLRNLSSSEEPTPESYYFEPAIALVDGNWILYGVIDYLNHPNLKSGAGAVADPFKQWRLGGGINWVPVAVARYRMTVLSHDYVEETNSLGGQERDYYSTELSMSVAF